MSYPWFYLENIPVVGEQSVMSGNEARHMTGARRLDIGDQICLFDGKGHVAIARIEAVGGRGRNPVLAIEEVADQARPRLQIHLASALPKGDRQGVMLDMVTQLGISSFTPLHCEFSVTRASEKSLARFQRIVVETCKQSRQAFLPEIRPAKSPFGLLENSDTSAWFAHPGEHSTIEQIRSAIKSDSISLLVGPEGGFSEAEARGLNERGATGMSLGDSILRTETAAVAIVSNSRLVLCSR